MKLSYENKPEFKIAGISIEVKDYDDYKKLRDSLFKKASRDELMALGNGMSYGLKEFNAITQSYNYTVGFDVEDENKAKDLGLLVMPILSYHYLIIPVEENPKQALPQIYDYIYKEYFPNRKYFHALSPDVEAYYADNNTELWIPLLENPHKERE